MEGALDGKDSDQTPMMSESCIIVDNEDVAIGSLSKLESHYMAGSLHRAFSVLLFNSKTSCSSRSVPRARSPSHPYGPTVAAATH